MIERFLSGARIAQRVGPQTQNLEVPGSIPGLDGSFLGDCLTMLGHVFSNCWAVF